MLDNNDLRSGLDQVLKIPQLVTDACSLADGGQAQAGQQKFQEALVIATTTQALLMLNLARLAMQAGDLALCESYCQAALEGLEMVGCEDGALGKAALATLALLAASTAPVQPGKKDQSKRRR